MYRFASRLFRLPLFLLLFLSLGAGSLLGQIDTTRPRQLNHLKVGLSQCFLNEGKILFEHEIREGITWELGVGVIYPNPFWVAQGTEFLHQGASAQFGMRFYSKKKSYFKESYFRPFVSPLLYYRYSFANDKWVYFPNSQPALEYTLNFSEWAQQFGTRILFGVVNTRGRFVMDLYGGLGIKWMPMYTELHWMNESSDVMEILPTSTALDGKRWVHPMIATIHAGVNIGIRGKNKPRPENFDEPLFPKKKKVETDLDVEEQPY